MSLMRTVSGALLSICLLSLLTSCKLKPIYSDLNNNPRGNPKITALNNATSRNINSRNIIIEEINSIEGAYFYHHLRQILFPPLPGEEELPDNRLSPEFILKTILAYSNYPGIIQPNSDILQETQTVTVIYSLTDLKNQKIITEGKFVKFTSYSMDFLPYINNIAREEAKKNLAVSAAEEVRNRLILFFLSYNS